MDAKEKRGIIGDALAEDGVDYKASARKLVTMPEPSLASFIVYLLKDRDKWRRRHEALVESVDEMCERINAEARPRD